MSICAGCNPARVLYMHLGRWLMCHHTCNMHHSVQDDESFCTVHHNHHHHHRHHHHHHHHNHHYEHQPNHPTVARPDTFIQPTVCIFCCICSSLPLLLSLTLPPFIFSCHIYACTHPHTPTCSKQATATTPTHRMHAHMHRRSCSDFPVHLLPACLQPYRHVGGGGQGQQHPGNRLPLQHPLQLPVLPCRVRDVMRVA